MAYYFYVKSGYGTRSATLDSPFTTPQNTTFALLAPGDVYASIDDATIISSKTNSPTSGDHVRVSHLHNASYTPASTDVRIGANNAINASEGLIVASVDDTACDTYKPGATEDLGGTQFDFHLYGNGILAGFTLRTGDNVLASGSSFGHWDIIDCTLTVEGNLDLAIRANIDGVQWRLFNVDINTIATNITAGLIQLTNSCRVEWFGGAVGGNGIPNGGTIINSAMGYAGGAIFSAYGVDFTACNSADLMPSCPAINTDEVIFIYSGCKLTTTATLPTYVTNLTLPRHRFRLLNSDDTTNDDAHRFFEITGAGSAENNDTIYVTDTAAWGETAVKSSIQVKTSSLCSQVHPFVFDMLGVYAKITDAATDKIIVNLVTDAALTDADIAAFIMYEDGTVAMQYNFLHTHPVAAVGGYSGRDPLTTGSTLTNDATHGLAIGDWESGASGLTPYTLILDTNDDPGVSNIIGVRIEVYKDFTTGLDVLYIDSDLAVGA